MADNFSVTIEGDEALDKLLNGIALRGDDMRPLFRGPIDKSVTLMFRAQFASSGAFGGAPWAPLRPSTRQWRQRRGGNRGGLEHPLWDTGEGKASFEKVGPNSFRDITTASYERGSMLPRMALHQTGYTITQWGGHRLRHPRRVPARPIIPDPIPEFILSSWATMIEDYLVAVKKAGSNG
jgi:Ni/Co efflux regulator RcnB